MKKLKIAYSENALQAFGAVDGREIIDVNNTDYTDVAAVVITEQDSDVLKFASDKFDLEKAKEDNSKIA